MEDNEKCDIQDFGDAGKVTGDDKIKRVLLMYIPSTKIIHKIWMFVILFPSFVVVLYRILFIPLVNV